MLNSVKTTSLLNSVKFKYFQSRLFKPETDRPNKTQETTIPEKQFNSNTATAHLNETQVCKIHTQKKTVFHNPLAEIATELCKEMFCNSFLP